MSLRHRYFDAAGKSFEVDRIWEWQQQRRFTQLLDELRRTKQGDTCIVVGNGPSLNATDLSLLASSDVFISNFAFEHPALLKNAKLLAIVNHLVAEQAPTRLAEVVGDSIPVLTTSHLRYALPASVDAYYVPMATTPEFQLTPRFGASCQSSVTYFLLQLAYWVGYRRVLLVGVDNSYQQPDVAEGEVLLQQGFDPNHFSGAYFEGKHWHAADVDRMAAAYEFARDAFSANGRSVVDCTVGGKLVVFPKAELAEALEATVGAGPSVDSSLTTRSVRWWQGFFEHFGLPVLVASAALMVVAIIVRIFIPVILSQASLTLLMAFLVLLLSIACIGVMKRQLRQSSARTRFDLGVLRSLVSRQKHI